MTDGEKAELRGSVKSCVEETTYPAGKSLTTTEYGLDGRLLTTRTSNSDGSECFRSSIDLKIHHVGSTNVIPSYR
jgi:hypothetical protein